jgi:hypothetical protein
MALPKFLQRVQHQSRAQGVPGRPRPIDDEGYKIIGLELRIIDPVTGQREELMLIPMDLDLPHRYNYGGSPFFLNITVHSTHGDVNFPQDCQLPW